ncbi:phosphopantetheine-binding protein [Streptomyces bohaiensis]|uniref:Phosphopantetheine-binding protein n=1 Tax=Streptomyces bohaiensis TaxID=1431344 RepID=A0ABX1C5D4_9ACTN|nr:phosphopantetheine-binding protein [Streptomyces bohaiensis]NJQ14429.1 phosphopantetheine-binding protein [Streptomyces bohaiensis]
MSDHVTAHPDREEVLAVLRTHLLTVLPDLDPALMVPERSLRDLGANSMDRLDVVVATQEDFGLVVSPGELTEANSLAELADVLAEHRAKGSA